MKTRNKIITILFSLIATLALSIAILRYTVDCTLHVYYIDSNGATIMAPRTFAGRWLSSVEINTKIDGYRLKNKVVRSQRLALNNKSVILKYTPADTSKQIKKRILQAKYLGVASQLVNTRNISQKQVDPLDGTAILRVVTSNDGKKWRTQALNYPNVNIRYPRIFNTGHYWLILGDNKILSTNNFSDWNYSQLSLKQKKYAGIFSPSLVKSGNVTYIVFQSWTKNNANNTKLYFAEFNPENSAIGIPQELSINKKAAALQGFSIKYMNGSLVLTGIDTSTNKILMYRSSGIYNHFSSIRVKQNTSIDNLSAVSLLNIGGSQRLYYSSYRVSGSVGWRNNVKYMNLNGKKINYKKASYVNTATLLTNLSILKN